MDENIPNLNFWTAKSEDYKVKAIWDNAVYAKGLELGLLINSYYLVF